MSCVKIVGVPTVQDERGHAKQLIFHRSRFCRPVENSQAGLYERPKRIHREKFWLHWNAGPWGEGPDAFVNELASTGNFVRPALSLIVLEQHHSIHLTCIENTAPLHKRDEINYGIDRVQLSISFYIHIYIYTYI